MLLNCFKVPVQNSFRAASVMRSRQQKKESSIFRMSTVNGHGNFACSKRIFFSKEA